MSCRYVAHTDWVSVCVWKRERERAVSTTTKCILPYSTPYKDVANGQRNERDARSGTSGEHSEGKKWSANKQRMQARPQTISTRWWWKSVPHRPQMYSFLNRTEWESERSKKRTLMHRDKNKMHINWKGEPDIERRYSAGRSKQEFRVTTRETFS